MPRPRRNILLIGAGGWGATHLAAYLASARWKIAAVADTNEDVLRHAQKLTGLPKQRLYSDAMQAISAGGYDAIAVIVRNPFRVPILLAAIKTGAPIFTEKPMVHTQADLRRVCRAVKKSGSVIMVSQNYRFERQTRRIAEVIQSGALGNLRSMLVTFARDVTELGDHYCRTLPAGLGLGAEMSIHHYDLMRFFTGRTPIGIRANARNNPKLCSGWTGIDAWIDWDGGGFINYHADYDVAAGRTPWGGRWEMEFDAGSLTWHPYADGKLPVEFRPSAAMRKSTLSGRIVAASGLRVRPLKDEFRFHLVDHAFREFTDALDEARQPECGLHDHAQSLGLMWAVNQAAASGKTVKSGKLLNEVTTECL